MLSEELRNVQDRNARSVNSEIVEANVLALGSGATKYKIQLRGGSVISDVQGPAGLYVGQSVTVAVHPGKVKKYAILGSGYRNTATIKEVWT